MHCEQLEALLGKLVFDELDEATKRAALDHLAGCRACKELFLDMRSAALLVKEGLEAGTAPVLSAERKQRIMNRQGAKDAKGVVGSGVVPVRTAQAASKPVLRAVKQRSATGTSTLPVRVVLFRVFAAAAAVLLVAITLAVFVLSGTERAVPLSEARIRIQNSARARLLAESGVEPASGEGEATEVHKKSLLDLYQPSLTEQIGNWFRGGEDAPSPAATPSARPSPSERPTDVAKFSSVNGTWADRIVGGATAPAEPAKVVNRLDLSGGQSFGWKQKAPEAKRETTGEAAGDEFAYARAPATTATVRPPADSAGGPVVAGRYGGSLRSNAPAATPPPPPKSAVVAKGAPVPAVVERRGIPQDAPTRNPTFFFSGAKESDHNESADGEDYRQMKGDAKDHLSYLPGEGGGIRGRQAGKGPGVYDTLGVGGGGGGKVRGGIASGGYLVPDSKPAASANKPIPPGQADSDRFTTTGGELRGRGGRPEVGATQGGRPEVGATREGRPEAGAAAGKELKARTAGGVVAGVPVQVAPKSGESTVLDSLAESTAGRDDKSPINRSLRAKEQPETLARRVVEWKAEKPQQPAAEAAARAEGVPPKAVDELRRRSEALERENTNLRGDSKVRDAYIKKLEEETALSKRLMAKLETKDIPGIQYADSRDGKELVQRERLEKALDNQQGGEKRQEVEKIRAERDQASYELQQARRELEVVNKSYSELERQTIELAKEKDKQGYVLQELVRQGVPVNGIAAHDVPKNLAGKIKSVSEQFSVAIVSIGQDDGVKVGYPFTICRDGDKFVARGTVEKIERDWCVVRWDPGLVKDKVQVGDDVTTSIAIGPTAEPREKSNKTQPSEYLKNLAQRERFEKAIDHLQAGEKRKEPARPESTVTLESAPPPFVRLKPEEPKNLAIEEPRIYEDVNPDDSRKAQQQAQQSEPDESLPSASFFKAGPVNPWVLAQRDRFSTFALAVDTASYTLARRFLQKGFLPPAASVRMEELINAFDYNYPGQTSDVFAIHVEGAPSPFRPSLTLLKVGVKGKVLGREGRKPAHLVFVIDGSGSMARPDRLPLIQYALRGLAGQLGPADRVSVVVFGTEARLAAEAVPAARRAEILAAIDSVQPAGPTNLLLGLQLGYAVAQRQFRAGEINRVILCTDGVANIGSSDADEMLGNVKAYRDQGVTFTAAGFGTGSYNDALLARLAAQGDGRYVFIDSAAEARRVFVEEMAATLQSIAVDAKIQVEFDPARVRRYRLIGYEARAIRDEDFRNDAIEAAEVGSGQSATALYEVELADDGAWMAVDDVRAGTSPAPRRDAIAGCPVPAASLGTVFVRYRNADTGKIEEIAKRVEAGTVRRRTAEESPRFLLAAAVAELAELLRESEYAQGSGYPKVAAVLAGVARQLPLDKKVKEIADLAARAQGLSRAQ